MAAPSKAGGLDKNKKYDRQLRLWGDHGQNALESAKVCLINATATGTEIMKNLILPGVGTFTIVDDHKVTGEDVGNNFFLDKESIGKFVRSKLNQQTVHEEFTKMLSLSRAQTATDLLLELNDDVTGNFVEEGPETLLESNPSFFEMFSLVIAVDVPERILLNLAAHLWDQDIPLLICRSYGFLGYMRLVIREHTVIESHPDNAHEDLRLDTPFPGLVQYCDSVDLDAMNKKEHMHTPWLVLVYKYLQSWKKEHDGNAPKNYKEKDAFKKLLRQGIRKNEDGIPEEEENFDEAIKNVNVCLMQTRVPSTVREIFNDNSCTNLNPDSKPFWILARAVKDFVENEGNGALPLRGSIPDMTADSERYIQLQKIYRDQASKDADNVINRVYSILQALGRDEPIVTSELNSRSPSRSPKPQDTVTETEIRLFCKNAAFLHVVRCRSLEQEYNSETSKMLDLASQLEDSDDDDTVWYVLLRSVDRFYMEYNRYPGVYEDQVETDIPKLKTCLSRLLQEWGVGQTIKDDFIHEMCRYGASELHSVASFLGGVAAHEAIKIVTKQFIPFNNTYLYNAMKQTSMTLQL